MLSIGVKVWNELSWLIYVEKETSENRSWNNQLFEKLFKFWETYNRLV